MTTPRPRADAANQITVDTPYNIARRYAEADLRADATTAETCWLHAHPLIWLRILTSIRREVETHIAKDKRSLSEHKPAAYEDQSVWLRVKADYDSRARSRLHFLQKVKTRAEEVKSLISVEAAVDRMLVADVVEDLLDVAALAEQGDLDSIRQKSHALAAKWVDRYASPRIPADVLAVAQQDPELAVTLGGPDGDLTLTVRPESADSGEDGSAPPYIEVDVRADRGGLTFALETSMEDREVGALVTAVETALGVARRRAAERGHYEWLAGNQEARR